MSVATLFVYDYLTLIKAENIRRQQDEPQRALLEGPPKKTADPLTVIQTALRSLDGRLTRKRLAEAAGVGVSTVDRYDYHDLIEAENVRRQKKEPQRELLIPDTLTAAAP